jgi:signal transduction histidine kinase
MERAANVAPAFAAGSYNGDSDFVVALQAAKLQALYNFAYGLSHEINNPLANIATRAQTLLIDEQDPQRRRKLATIVQQAFRAHEMIADLMLFARPPTPRLEAVDLAKLADTVVAEMQEQAREQETRLVRSGDEGPFIATVDPTQIAVALKALVQNSLEALKRGGRVEVLSTEYSIPSTHPVAAEVTTTIHNAHSPSPAHPQSAIRNPHLSTPPRSTDPRCWRPGTPGFLLSVTDTGLGIPPEVRRHIFDPFFSGREAGRGLGLGLSKAWRIVDLHGGQITVESNAGQGARFTIVLPRTL